MWVDVLRVSFCIGRVFLLWGSGFEVRLGVGGGWVNVGF